MIKNIIFLFISIITIEANSLYSLEISDQVCSENECYTVVKELGQGAFGTVFSVSDSQGKTFALKTYKHDYDSAYYNDMEREFGRGQLLDHPNIIKSYEHFSDDSESYLVLQLVDGDSLRDTERKSLSGDQAIQAGVHFVDALRYAYSMDLLYLDLHEGNVMISTDPDAMIVDLASFFTYDEVLQEIDETTTSTVSARQAKVLKFVSENPELVKKLRYRKQVKALSSSYTDEIATRELNAYYLRGITDIFHNIIAKSNLGKERKIELYAKIKAFSWGFSEDIEDGLNPSLEEQFHELIKVY